MPETTEIANETLKSVNQNGIAKKVAVPKIDQIRSDEVQEIISAVPNWMIRWGITLIFGLIVMLVTLSWFIKYPDIIFGNATLTTLQPPVKLVVKSSGKLTTILLADGSTVEKNQVIAEMENPITQEGIEFLKNYVLEIRGYLKSSKNELPLIKENHVFGAMQTNFNELQKNSKNYDEQIKNIYNTSKINNLKKKKQEYQTLITISIKQ
ncbi:MAG: hypothetical protein RQ875_14445, partial [Vicingaceae bacterium]|nr:hypothetical protein [Vicingaceae bacterium]